MNRGLIDYYTKPTRLPAQILDSALYADRTWNLDQKSDAWAAIVVEYSLRNLTDPEERLNALAGASSELEARWKDDYACGMWRTHNIPLPMWE